MIRGEIYRLPSPPRARGHEQRGERFAVVLQADELAHLSTAVVAPTSTGSRPASFRPLVEIGGVATRVMVEQLRAVDPSRLGRRSGRLSWDEMASVDRALRLMLAL